jgi:hypothetical protein
MNLSQNFEFIHCFTTVMFKTGCFRVRCSSRGVDVRGKRHCGCGLCGYAICASFDSKNF